MAMRLISGGTVASLLREGPIERSRTVRILEDVAAALDYAHVKGVVHRDVKPPNILLDEEDRAYLADFGVARMREGSTFLTQTGVLAGPPPYMAPEQAQSGAATHPRDVYAFSVGAYELLTGPVPLPPHTPLAPLVRHRPRPVPRPPPAGEPPGTQRAGPPPSGAGGGGQPQPKGGPGLGWDSARRRLCHGLRLRRPGLLRGREAGA